MDNKHDTHSTQLEPRVAKLETGLELLTKDVASLAHIVREQGGNIENQIRELAVNITQAAAPRKTDWPTLIALIMLIMAIGSAVFWPLNQAVGNNREELRASDLRLQMEFKTADAEINHRLMAVEANMDRRITDDLGELRGWRLRAMGVTNGTK